VKQIIENNGPHSDITFEVHKRLERFMIDSEPSFKIDGHIHEIFSIPVETLKNFPVLVIDGVVEKVSEIDALLRSCAEEDANLLICANNFSPDVVSTLYENFKNKKLRVVPFKTTMTPQVKNALLKTDISHIDPSSSALLSTLQIYDIDSSKDILVTSSGIKILNTDGIDRHVKISIPSHFKSQAGLIEDRVKFGMSIASQASKYGVVIDEEDNAFSSIFSYSVGKKCKDSIKNTLESLGCIILQET
jgi:hypothetical protein